jgi:hypothetical protein
MRQLRDNCQWRFCMTPKEKIPTVVRAAPFPRLMSLEASSSGRMGLAVSALSELYLFREWKPYQYLISQVSYQFINGTPVAAPDGESKKCEMSRKRRRGL